VEGQETPGYTKELELTTLLKDDPSENDSLIETNDHSESNIAGNN
jgi:hypothetical protein